LSDYNEETVSNEFNTILQYVKLTVATKYIQNALVLMGFTHVTIGSVKAKFSLAGR